MPIESEEAQELSLAIDTFDLWFADQKLASGNEKIDKFIRAVSERAWVQAWCQGGLRGCDKASRIFDELFKELEQ